MEPRTRAQYFSGRLLKGHHIVLLARFFHSPFWLLPMTLNPSQQAVVWYSRTDVSQLSVSSWILHTPFYICRYTCTCIQTHAHTSTLIYSHTFLHIHPHTNAGLLQWLVGDRKANCFPSKTCKRSPSKYNGKISLKLPAPLHKKIILLKPVRKTWRDLLCKAKGPGLSIISNTFVSPCDRGLSTQLLASTWPFEILENVSLYNNFPSFNRPFLLSLCIFPFETEEQLQVTGRMGRT